MNNRLTNILLIVIVSLLLCLLLRPALFSPSAPAVAVDQQGDFVFVTQNGKLYQYKVAHYKVIVNAHGQQESYSPQLELFAERNVDSNP